MAPVRSSRPKSSPTPSPSQGNLDIDGIVVGHPSVDTLKIVSDRMIAATPDRNAFLGCADAATLPHPFSGVPIGRPTMASWARTIRRLSSASVVVLPCSTVA